jgi:hypothetical protein
MPIPFGCECGKRLQAKDEFAGKKMKCPGCGKLLEIPRVAPAPEMPQPGPAVREPIVPEAHSEDLAAGPPSAPPAPPGPALVHFVCSCGRRLKARRQDAGADIECPDCGRTLAIPAADTETPPPPVVAVPRPVGDGFLSQTVTPWPDAETRRRGSDGPEPEDERVGSRAGAVVLLVLLVAVAVWSFFRSEIKAAADARQPQAAEVAHAAHVDFDELKVVPANALAVLTWQRGDLAVPEPGVQEAFAQGTPARSVLRPNNRIGRVERLTYVAQLPDPMADKTAGQKGAEKDVWTIVRTAFPYERKAVFQALWPKGDIVPTAHRGRTYFLVYPAAVRVPVPPKGKRQGFQAAGSPEDAFQVSQGPMPPKLKMGPKGKGPIVPKGASPIRIPAVYFASPHVFVVGDQVSIKRLLQGKKLGPSGPQDEAVDRARKGAALVIALNQNEVKLKGTLPATEANVPPLTAALQEFTTAFVAVDAARDAGHGKGWLKQDLHFEFANAKAAQAARQSLLRWKGQQAERHAEARTRIEAKQTEEALKATLRTLGAATPGRFSPVGGLNFAPQMPEMTMPKEDAEELARLKTEEAVAEGLADLSLTANTMNVRLLLPPEPADLAWQMWAPYAELAIRSLPQPRQAGPPPKKKGGLPPKKKGAR